MLLQCYQSLKATLQQCICHQRRKKYLVALDITSCNGVLLILYCVVLLLISMCSNSGLIFTFQDPFVNIAFKKPIWDLSRDVQKKLDKLERRTQKAIYKLMGKWLESTY